MSIHHENDDGLGGHERRVGEPHRGVVLHDAVGEPQHGARQPVNQRERGESVRGVVAHTSPHLRPDECDAQADTPDAEEPTHC